MILEALSVPLLTRENKEIVDYTQRRELVGRMVLNAICDDFENIDQIILADVSNQAAEYGLTIERSAVVDALTTLVEDGLTKAYRLSAFDGSPFDGRAHGHAAGRRR